KQARRAALLHDIGKALTHEVEGSHAIIGGEIARKYGESAKIVNAIAAHHEEVKVETILAPLVDAADALSGARPRAPRAVPDGRMRLLFLGDVVGRPGRRALAALLPRLAAREHLDFVVANCENASGGKGIDPRSADELHEAGVDVLTSGNHIWQHRDIVPYMREQGRLLRPLNFPPGIPGVGWTVQKARHSDTRVAVLNLIGRVFMAPVDCPFRAAEQALADIRREARVVLVDMHAEATSEKVAMGRFLDGKVSAVIGSHTHVQTADEAILPGGTAYLTDAGMCGPDASILGVKIEQVLRRFLTQMPTRFEVASGAVLVQGALIEVDEATGRATGIRRVQERVTA